MATERRPMSIEYCTSWGYLAKAASLAEDLLHDNPDTLSGVTLIPSSGGVYEITLGGQLIFSKKETGEFPDPEQIKQQVAVAWFRPRPRA